jgi:hypothetical protein
MINSESYNPSEPALPCTTDWNVIEWHKIEKYVNNLQQRIISCRVFERLS